jgi:acetyltransferase-like isoleucine patch superfamily enzyme
VQAALRSLVHVEPYLTPGEHLLRKASGAAALLRGKLLTATLGLRCPSGDLRVGRRVVLRGVLGMEFGVAVMLTDDVWLNALVELAPHPPPVLRLGDRVALGRRSIISAASSVVIGPGTITAPNVLIVDHNHAHGATRVAVRDQGITQPQPVIVGAGCWLGANAVVLPGTRLGDGSVVGANSVVKGAHPAGSVLVGSPAVRVAATSGPA